MHTKNLWKKKNNRKTWNKNFRAKDWIVSFNSVQRSYGNQAFGLRLCLIVVIKWISNQHWVVSFSWIELKLNSRRNSMKPNIVSCNFYASMNLSIEMFRFIFFPINDSFFFSVLFCCCCVRLNIRWWMKIVPPMITKRLWLLYNNNKIDL